MASTFSRPRIVDYIGWALLAAALIFAIYVRVRLREFPFERDEGEFAYAGQLIRQGVPPYKLAYNMKLPGTYMAYAALMTVFGESTAGVHLGLMALNAATIVLLFFFVRELFDPFSAGIAAVAYAILSESPGFLGMAAHATHFVAFFGLAGTYLLWRHLQSGKWWQAVASGLFMGIAFLMKQQGVFLMVFGGTALVVYSAAVVVKSLRQNSFSVRQVLPSALNILLFSVFAVLPYLLICLWLWQAGVFEKFWFWTYKYASQYVSEMPLSLASAYFGQAVSEIVPPNWPLLLLALTGIVGVAILGQGKPGLRSFVYGFLLFSFLCTCPGFYFRQHYFIVMLPVVAMLAGVGSRLLWDLASGRFWTKVAVETAALKQDRPAAAGRDKRSRAKIANEETRPVPSSGFGPMTALVALVLAAAVGWTIFGTTVRPQQGWTHADFFFKWPPQLACRIVYGLNPFLECPEIAKYLEKNSTPVETIAVMGSEPEIFFDAHRNSASGYIYTYGMMERQPFARTMQEEMAQQIEAAKPQFIVFVNVSTSWLPQNDERHIFQWIQEYLTANYVRVGVADLVAFDHTEYKWGEEAESYQPRSQNSLFVFRRK